MSYTHIKKKPLLPTPVVRNDRVAMDRIAVFNPRDYHPYTSHYRHPHRYAATTCPWDARRHRHTHSRDPSPVGTRTFATVVAPSELEKEVEVKKSKKPKRNKNKKKKENKK